MKKEQADRIVEAVTIEILKSADNINESLLDVRLRTALIPFAMEMTDDMIEGVSTLFSTGHCHILDGMESEWLLSHAFQIGAKFIRDGK